MKDRPTLAYSTATPQQKNPSSSKKEKDWARSAGPAKMRLETKGRGGKSVTVLFNLPMSRDEAKILMRELQELCACGASIKDGMIEIQGDVRVKAEEHFKAKNITLVRAGG